MKEVRRLSHGELVQMSIAAQNEAKAEPKQIRRLSHGELAQMSVAAQNGAKQAPNADSTKYLNKTPVEDIFGFFIPFGIDDSSQVQEKRDANGKIESLKFFCDDFNATLSSDFKFQFDFFDHYAGDRNSLGKTIKYYEICQLSDMLNLSRAQTMSLMLAGFFMGKYPEYKTEWKHHFEAGNIPAFKQGSMPKSFMGLDTMQTVFELTKLVKESQAELVGKELA